MYSVKLLETGRRPIKIYAFQRMDKVYSDTQDYALAPSTEATRKIRINHKSKLLFSGF